MTLPATGATLRKQRGEIRMDIERYKNMSEDDFRKIVKKAAPKKIIFGAVCVAIPLAFLKVNGKKRPLDWSDGEFMDNVVLFIMCAIVLSGIFSLVRGISQWNNQENDVSNFSANKLYGNWRQFERCIKSALSILG